jgi:hypothetical protein
MAKRSSMTIKVETADLQKAILAKKSELKERLLPVLNSHAEQVLRDAQSRIHNISGETARSLKVIEVFEGKTAVGYKVGPDPSDIPGIIRARSLEFGHASKGNKGGAKITPAHPYLRPSFDIDKKLTKKDIASQIKQMVDDFNK